MTKTVEDPGLLALNERQADERARYEADAARAAEALRLRAAGAEASRQAQLCRYPGCENRGLPRTFNGAPADLRTQLWEVGGATSAIVKARLCESHYAATAYALGRQVYDADSAGCDAFARQLFEAS